MNEEITIFINATNNCVSVFIDCVSKEVTLIVKGISDCVKVRTKLFRYCTTEVADKAVSGSKSIEDSRSRLFGGLCVTEDTSELTFYVLLKRCNVVQ